MPSSFYPQVRAAGRALGGEPPGRRRRRRARAARSPHAAQRPLGPGPPARRHPRRGPLRGGGLGALPDRLRRGAALAIAILLVGSGRAGLYGDMRGGKAGGDSAAAAVERRFERVLDHLHAMLLEFDASGRISYVSSTVTEILGYLPEEIRELRRFEWIHAEDVAQILELSRKLASTGESAEAVYRARHKQGRWLWLEMAATSSCDARRRHPHARLRARRDAGAPGRPRAAHHRGPLPRDGGERGGPDQRDRRHRPVRVREPELPVAAGHAGRRVSSGSTVAEHDQPGALAPGRPRRHQRRASSRASRAAARPRSSIAIATPTEAGAGSRRVGAATAPRAASCACC